MSTELLPFLKWAGGKRWLVQSGQLPTPTEYRRYVEPFLGSGAVYFHLKPESALLTDSNPALIELYEVMRDSPVRLRHYMHAHHHKHCADYYYSVRSEVPRGKVQRAARLLYLNRTCWNGLYRVNREGWFNVPIGTKSTVVLESDDFTCTSRILKGARLQACDFEQTFSDVGAGDFVFVDPPYTVKHNINNFLKYNEQIFSWSDQERLRDCVVRAARIGAFVVVTNADHDQVRKLYRGIATYNPISRYSVLSGEAKFRRPTTEALFRVNF